MSSAETFDAVVIGGGHNGLVCAFYLARAGKRVCIVERREIVGGAAVTEEFHPGFRNSTASYSVSLLNPKVIADMALARHGLEVRLRPMAYFVPGDGGSYLLLGRDEAENTAAISRLSPRDAVAYPAFHKRLDALVDLFRETLFDTPPNPDGGLRDIIGAMKLAARLNRVGIEAQRDLIDLFGKSAGEMLDNWFESDLLKGALGFDAITGAYASPYAPGSAYVLLHHVFGEANGVRGAWGHAMGGMGAITQAMARACLEHGVDIRVSSPVVKVLLDGKTAVGVELEGGRAIRARAVISGVHPRLLFERMLPAEALPDAFRDRIRTWKSGSGVFRMNVALSEVPDFTCLPSSGPGRHHGASILVAPSLTYLDTACQDARRDGWSRRPAIEMHIPSLIDPGLAPPGQHVASLFCQYFAPHLPDGRSWESEQDAAAETVIDTVTRLAPNFRNAIIGKIALSPLDLETRLGLVDGDIFHGQLRLDQLFSARPMLGHADYRSPLTGLYMCGSSTHPGGGVTGVPGHNAAREILRDLGKRTLRRKPAPAAG
jgi:phytoene dehydrogenase-like protein